VEADAHVGTNLPEAEVPHSILREGLQSDDKLRQWPSTFFSLHLTILLLLLMSTCNPQNKVDNHRSQQGHSKYRRPIPIVKSALPSDPDTFCSPMKCCESVYHSCHGDECEEGGGDTAHGITEIEEADSEATKNDGEVEPRKKCAFIGEEHLRLDAGG
jgi:hypothetical protein